MTQPLLSVIVPCYNSGNYMDKCIASIVSQTYTNLEILLVNDGSTDQTGKKCDTWQERDTRIRAIHKQNEGPSFARRTGIEYMTGDYVAFVDSDDWIDTAMYAGMMEALLSTGSDIVHCDYCHVYEDGRIEASPLSQFKKSVDKPEVFERQEGVLMLLEGNVIQSFMWNKIFKKKLFESIVFPKDLFFEDVYIMHYLMHNAEKSVHLNEVYYFYYQRTGSTCNPDTIEKTVQSNLYWAMAHYDRYLFTARNPQYHKALQNVKEKMLYRGLIFLRNLVDYPNILPNETYKQQSRLLKSVPLSYHDRSFFLKIDFLILKIAPCCYKPFYAIFYRHLTRIIRDIKNDR